MCVEIEVKWFLLQSPSEYKSLSLRAPRLSYVVVLSIVIDFGIPCFPVFRWRSAFLVSFRLFRIVQNSLRFTVLHITYILCIRVNMPHFRIICYIGIKDKFRFMICSSALNYITFWIFLKTIFQTFNV